MELKNAAAVCLISLFSATLVVLIARSLDVQAASRIEPQLAKIVEELQALRQQRGLAPAPGAAIGNATMHDGLMVYYFHGNTRCPKCRSIESQSYDTVHTDFASQLESGAMEWKIVNYEEPAGADLGKKFEILMPVVVLARIGGGKIGDWKRLDKVWALVGDQRDFAAYLHDEIDLMLSPANGPRPAPSDLAVPDDLPVPDEDPVPEQPPSADTVPVPDDLPVPE
jgi:hypothetical protein